MVRALLVLSVFLFSVAAALGQSVLREFEVRDAEVRNKESIVQASSRYPQAAMVFVYSAIQGLIFKGSLEIHAFSHEADEGYYRLLVPANRQRITVLAPGFRARELGLIDLSPKDVKAFEVREQVAVAFRPAWAELLIRVSPADAELTIDGRVTRLQNGKIHFQGEAGIATGTHTVVVSKENFRTEHLRIELQAGDQKQMDIELKPISGRISVKSIPSGATVLLNGQTVGTTPYVAERPVGTYTLRIQLRDHVDVERAVIIREEVPVEVQADLFNYARTMAPLIRARKISAAVAVAGLAAGTWFMIRTMVDYNRYQTATTQAAEYRGRLEVSRAAWPVSMVIGAAGSAGAYYFDKQLRSKKQEYRLGFSPLEKGGAFTLVVPLGNKIH